jgi:hypothetical protein
MLMNADKNEESADFVEIWKTLQPSLKQKTIEELLTRQGEAMVVHDRGVIVYANQCAADCICCPNPCELVGRDMIDEIAHPLSRRVARLHRDSGCVHPLQVLARVLDAPALFEIEQRRALWRGQEAFLALITRVPLGKLA